MRTARMPSKDYPFERSMLIVLAMAGIAAMIGGPRPESLQALLPHWLFLTWSGFVTFGCLIALVGLFWRGRFLTSIGIESTGLWLLSGGCAAYAVGVLAYGGLTGFFAAALSVAIAWGCLSRTAELYRARHRYLGRP